MARIRNQNMVVPQRSWARGVSTRAQKQKETYEDMAASKLFSSIASDPFRAKKKNPMVAAVLVPEDRGGRVVRRRLRGKLPDSRRQGSPASRARETPMTRKAKVKAKAIAQSKQSKSPPASISAESEQLVPHEVDHGAGSAGSALVDAEGKAPKAKRREYPLGRSKNREPAQRKSHESEHRNLNTLEFRKLDAAYVTLLSAVTTEYPSFVVPEGRHVHQLG